MIRMVIEISEVQLPGQTTEFGAGVRVATDPFIATETPKSEGATWVGLSMAINDYMRARGAPDFNCLAPHLPTLTKDS